MSERYISLPNILASSLLTPAGSQKYRTSILSLLLGVITSIFSLCLHAFPKHSLTALALSQIAVTGSLVAFIEYPVLLSPNVLSQLPAKIVAYQQRNLH